MMITTGGVNGILGEGESLHLLQGQENVEQVTEEEVFYHERGAKRLNILQEQKDGINKGFNTGWGSIEVYISTNIYLLISIIY